MGAGNQAAQDFLVAAMDTIEITQGENWCGEAATGALQMTQDQHRNFAPDGPQALGSPQRPNGERTMEKDAAAGPY